MNHDPLSGGGKAMRRVRVKWRELSDFQIGGPFCFNTYTAIGHFHGWGSAYEEFESGPANYTMAIVELSNGRIKTINPDDVVFLD